MSALRGIRVVELAESVAGEYCGKLLADSAAPTHECWLTRVLGTPTFWRDTDENLRCGLMDWGCVSQMNLGMAIWGAMSGAETEM